MPADDIENIVAPALGIDVELGDAPPFTETALLVLVAEQPALATVVVDKQRTLFDLWDCEAEFTELVIGDERLQTVALEAPEAHAEALLQRTARCDAKRKLQRLPAAAAVLGRALAVLRGR